ncbi:MAG: hypothetical protein J7L88_04385 [Thermoplasmata archaeon]|nr:hypothetical protein [Thermoplasmata archaeon]
MGENEEIVMEVGKEINLDDALLYLKEAEKELIEGSLIRSHTLSRKARRILQQAKEQHLRTIKGLRKFIDRMLEMKERGYDVSAAEEIFEEAVKAASSFRYSIAEDKLGDAWEALDKAEYIPFPLWEKDVMIKSVIYYEEGLVYYKIRVENYEEYPLGEILLRPALPDYFEGVEEMNLGVVGPKEYHEVTYRLKPKVENWSVGVDGKLLKENGVMVKTGLYLKRGEGMYEVKVENNSDAILRDVVVYANVPQGLRTDELEKVIDYIPPYGSGTVVFDVSAAPPPDRFIEEREDLIAVQVEDEEDSENLFNEEEEWEFDTEDEE